MASIPSLDTIPGRLSEGELWRLLGRVEHTQLDFKRGVPTDVRDTIAAMAMTHGGLVIHGIDDQRQIVGCPLSQNTQDRITRVAMECGVDVRLRAIAVGNTELTVTAIPEVRGRIVTTPDGRLLRRVGGDSQPLRGDAMARFVREREGRTAEDDPIASIDDSAFALEAINRALAADSRPPTDAAGISRALADLGVAIPAPPPLAREVLRAAIVLFAQEPRDFVRGAAVQLVRRTGVGPAPGPTVEREECAGPFADTVACCLDFIARHTRQLEAVTELQRGVFPEYPEVVIREAIVNALAHRDYGLAGATVDITVWDDRIEVRSPGALPGHITVDNMREEHYSRNPRIMRVLKTMGYVEEYGEGVDRMFRELESRLMEPPIFEATSGSVSVTIRNRVLVDAEDQLWLRQLDEAEPTPYERIALVAARRAGAVTPRSLRRLILDADARNVIAGAVAKGLLRRVGNRGGTRYVLTDAVIAHAGNAPPPNSPQGERQALLEHMRRSGSLSSTEAADLVGRDVHHVRDLLNQLVDIGLARAEGRTRARRYYPH